jgi:hypothetical protein
MSEDTIGVIQFEFVDWQTRPRAARSWKSCATRRADIPGILVEVTAPNAGPPTGKPIQVQLSALNPDMLPDAARKVAAILLAAHPTSATSTTACRCPASTGKSTSTAPKPRSTARRRAVGTAVQLVTNGVKITEYRPRKRQGGRHHRALSRGPPQPQPDRRPAHADARRSRADRQLRQARADPARRLHQPRRRQPA